MRGMRSGRCAAREGGIIAVEMSEVSAEKSGARLALQQMATRLASGDLRALSRAISMVEDDAESATALVAAAVAAAAGGKLSLIHI